MVELWNRLKINDCSGEICYDDQTLFSSMQIINELGELPFGEWVLLIDRQLMPMEAMNENLESNKVQLSGLVFDVCEGQDFYCDLHFSKNQLSVIDFGLTQKDDLTKEEVGTQFLIIKKWFEQQGLQLGSRLNDEEWLNCLICEQTVMWEAFSWGRLSLKYCPEGGLIKVSVYYGLITERGEVGE